MPESSTATKASPSSVGCKEILIASAVGDIAHRLNTVSDQVEQHLLQLNSVGQDWPIAGEKLDVKHNPAAFQFAAEDGQHLLDRFVDIDSRQFKPRLPRERVQTLDHIGCASAGTHEIGD